MTSPHGGNGGEKRRRSRGLAAFPKILFTTAYEPQVYDYIASNITGRADSHLMFERRFSYGLRFLQENIPGIEILEYPTWKEYQRAIEAGWDVVGYSFYTNEIPRIRRMVSSARAAGVSELWGGNYGVLTSDVAPLFDRIAVGYAEQQVADWLNVRLDRIAHPPLIAFLKLRNGLGLTPLGILFTSRGCNRGCTFCQTPAFCGRKISALPIESLAEVIDTYRRLRVGALMLLDESFGILPEHAERVVSLLDEASLPWLPMTRIDTLTDNLGEWGQQGLAGALLGIESFREAHLRGVKKETAFESTRKLIGRLRAEDRLVIGFNIIGFEDDTVESLSVDLNRLAELKLDVAQVCILTPFHQTRLWDRLAEQYGIDDADLSRFDGKHLVWNHPNFKAKDLENTLQDFFTKAYPVGREVETIRRFGRYLVRRVGIGAGLSFLAGSFLRTNVTMS